MAPSYYTRISSTAGLVFFLEGYGHKEAPPSRRGFWEELHVKEITLIDFLVVMKIPVPTALVDPLMVLSRLSQLLHSATSQGGHEQGGE
jgi:hypothetical protein